MGKKNHQNRQQQGRSHWIPPVGNGGITKKHQNNHPPPSFVAPNFPHQHAHNLHRQLPGYPILPFPVRLVPGGPQAPPGPPPFSAGLPFNHPPPPLYPPHAVPPPPIPPSAPSSVVFVPPAAVNKNPVNNEAAFKSPRRRAHKKGSAVVVGQGNSNRPGEVVVKKTQIKYARMMSARATKRTSTAVVQPQVKEESDAPSFNLFKNIAQRYRTVQKEPEAIQIQDDVSEDGEVEEIEPERENDAAGNITIVEDMSLITEDEVGERTIRPIDDSLSMVDEVGEETIRQSEEREEGRIDLEEEEGEKEGEIHVSEDEEEEEEEIVCLGEQKTNHVMSEVVILDSEDSEVEIEEIDSDNESNVLDKAFSEKRKSLRPMEDSIIDLSLDDDKNESETVATAKDLPDFIPLIDGSEKKKKRKGKQSSSPFVQGGEGGSGVQQKKGGKNLSDPSSSSSSSFPWSSTPLVMLVRSKSTRERKREMQRKRAETRAIEACLSPASVARAVAASTCSFPSAVPTPSKIPLPNAAAPPTPLADLYRFPPGSSSAMSLIQSRGFSTSAPQSQPLGMGGIGMSPPSLIPGGVSSGAPPTLAAVLHDETLGVVRDALTVNGIFRRQWEEKWMTQSDSFSPPDVKVDPSAAPFRICSYNVLCQKTISATQYLYRHTKFQPFVLEWEHRWPLIQKELSELNADVFGLQEIQDVHFEEYYEPFMKSLGYVCFYQPKSETIHSDGLGIFVRANRFKITSIQTVDFLVPGDMLMNRGNVAQLARVECLQTGASLIVTNTHILFNEKRGDVKLAQIAYLMANIHAIRQEDEPVICLGDWNLEPRSDLYNYITNGSLDASQFVPRYGSGQLREGGNFNFSPMREFPIDTHLKTKMSRDGVLYQSEGALLKSLQSSPSSMFSHQIPLTSTYAPYRERHVSTFHKDVANPDFIFYTTEGRGETESRRLRLIRRLAVPPESGIRQILEPWPNQNVPSDHIPLMAEFYLAK